MLLDYFKRNNLSYDIGSAELRNYLYEQLMYENDEKLKKNLTISLYLLMQQVI